jgi:cell division protein FtsL
MARGAAATATAPARDAGPAHAPARTRPAAPPRRRSGHAPARRASPAAPVDARRRAALALGRFVEARTQGMLDRLLRGRLWVGFVGALLAGIVFLNVSLLQLNQEIAHTTVQAAALDRENASLRTRLSALDSSNRIQRLAEQHGMTMPAPGQYRYLRARPWLDSELAARRAVPPRVATPTPTVTPVTATPVTAATSTTTATTATPGTP